MIAVKLVSYSQLPKETDIFDHTWIHDSTLLDLIAYCARVSNPENQMNKETNERLIRYLIKNKHWSPLEMVSVCVEISTTRDIARQILRHRSFSFQEFSQRYADPNNMDNTFITSEARLQDENNRQNSIVTEDVKLQQEWDRHQRRVIWMSKQVYQWAISNGIAKEQARKVLPEGLTKSVMLMNGTLRSWVHYLELRLEEGTQKEHREIAQIIANVINTIFPIEKLKE